LHKKCIKANAYKAKVGFTMGESQKIMAMHNYSQFGIWTEGAMKIQRSKAELLMQRRIYEAMVIDANEEHNIRGGVQHWCTEVAWAWVLMRREGLSANALNELMQHTRRYDIGDMKEEDSERISGKLRAAGVSLELKSHSLDGGRPRNNRMDAVVGELHEYNARVMTDYRLAACEYLHDVKGFRKKRLERDIAIEAIKENAGTGRMQEMRMDVYREKGIWIQMCEGDEPD
jgi:hypothetical protein